VVSPDITSGAQAKEANHRGRSFSAAGATGSLKDEGPRTARFATESEEESAFRPGLSRPFGFWTVTSRRAPAPLKV